MKSGDVHGNSENAHAAEQLRDRRARFETRRQQWMGRETAWSWTRLGLFSVALASWFVVSSWPLATAVITAGAIALFVVAVRQHHAARVRREAADRLLLVTDEALRRAGGEVCCIRDWRRPGDNADDDEALPAVFERGHVWPLTDQERDDLDVFAEPVGLFGLLNRTSTALGARRLRDMLENPGLDAERIGARQDMVRWLAAHTDQRLDLMASLAALRGEDRRMSEMIAAIRSAKPIPTLLPRAMLRVWSVLSVLFTIFVLTRVTISPQTELHWLLVWLGTLAANAMLIARGRRETSHCLAAWANVAWPARGFEQAARQAADSLPAKTELAGLRARCAAVFPREVLPTLRRRTAWADSGGPLWEAVNLIALVKLRVATGIARCAVPHRESLLAGLSAVAELDALCGLASFSWEQPTTCYPTISEETAIRITTGHHPLVPPGQSVPNSLELTPETRMWLVTGSNMAGKSTFLRMAGVNILLAQVGCAVTAEAMTWSPLRLISDLRARDNLAENESYFLAEVRHLRRLLVTPDDRVPLLGLIDEPFRGTNSHDQSAASVAVVGHLLGAHHLLLVATHDQHLTKLANGGPARNYHFRENLESKDLVFDYRLHEGPAQTRNALRILEREGYPPDLVETARNWLDD